MSRTRWPSFARPALRLTAVVLFPTPPFWLTSAMVYMDPPLLEFPRGAGHPRPRLKYNIQIVNYETTSRKYFGPFGRGGVRSAELEEGFPVRNFIVVLALA